MPVEVIVLKRLNETINEGQSGTNVKLYGSSEVAATFFVSGVPALQLSLETKLLKCLPTHGSVQLFGDWSALTSDALTMTDDPAVTAKLARQIEAEMRRMKDSVDSRREV